MNFKRPPKEEFEALMGQGLVIRQLAKHYGVAKITIGHWKRYYKLQALPPKQRKVPRPPASQLRKLREAGKSLNTIGQVLNCSARTVAKMFHAAGLSTAKLPKATHKQKPSLTPQQFANPFNLSPSRNPHATQP